MSPDARAEARHVADEDLKEMPLNELRAARHLTQQQLAKSLDMTQAAVSQLEQRTDVYLSTLENFIEAMGGRLEMYAVFTDGKVKLGLDREASQAFSRAIPQWVRDRLFRRDDMLSPPANNNHNGLQARAREGARSALFRCGVRSPGGSQMAKTAFCGATWSRGSRLVSCGIRLLTT